MTIAHVGRGFMLFRHASYNRPCRSLTLTVAAPGQKHRSAYLPTAVLASERLAMPATWRRRRQTAMPTGRMSYRVPASTGRLTAARHRRCSPPRCGRSRRAPIEADSARWRRRRAYQADHPDAHDRGGRRGRRVSSTRRKVPGRARQSRTAPRTGRPASRRCARRRDRPVMPVVAATARAAHRQKRPRSRGLAQHHQPRRGRGREKRVETSGRWDPGCRRLSGAVVALPGSDQRAPRARRAAPPRSRATNGRRLPGWGEAEARCRVEGGRRDHRAMG